MGRYRDHRGPRHHYHEPFSSSDNAAEPSYFRHSHDGGSASLEAQVLWFNASKGFGFVKASDGSQAYLSIRALDAAGKSSVSEGMQLRVRIEEGPKRLQVSQVLEVKTHPEQTSSEEVRGASTIGQRAAALDHPLEDRQHHLQATSQLVRTMIEMTGAAVFGLRIGTYASAPFSSTVVDGHLSRILMFARPSSPIPRERPCHRCLPLIASAWLLIIAETKRITVRTGSACPVSRR
jgi:cold shock CspA family protein